MKVQLTQPLKISDTQTVPAGTELEFEDSTAKDFIQRGLAKRVRIKHNQEAEDRQTKPDLGPTETK
jgi:hypothetical protein